MNHQLNQSLDDRLPALKPEPFTVGELVVMYAVLLGAVWVVKAVLRVWRRR